MTSVLKNIYLTLLSVGRMFYHFRKTSKLSKGQGFSKDIYIFGNGPTLQEPLNNIDFFQGKDVLVVNHFSQTAEYTKLKPKFYILVDPLFFDREDIDREHIERIEKALAMLVEKTTWAMQLFVSWEGYKTKSFRDRIAQNQNITLVPINVTRIEGFRWFRHWCYKRNYGMPSAQTVILPAIFCAVNTGYENIFLLGCENSWMKNFRVNDKNQLCIYDEHFYDNNHEQLKLVDEKYPYKYTLYSELISSAKVFYAHKLLEAYSKYQGVKIWNATQGSFIDAYERCHINFSYENTTQN